MTNIMRMEGNGRGWVDVRRVARYPDEDAARGRLLDLRRDAGPGVLYWLEIIGRQGKRRAQ